MRRSAIRRRPTTKVVPSRRTASDRGVTAPTREQHLGGVPVGAAQRPAGLDEARTEAMANASEHRPGARGARGPEVPERAGERAACRGRGRDAGGSAREPQRPSAGSRRGSCVASTRWRERSRTTSPNAAGGRPPTFAATFCSPSNSRASSMPPYGNAPWLTGTIAVLYAGVVIARRPVSGSNAYSGGGVLAGAPAEPGGGGAGGVGGDARVCEPGAPDALRLDGDPEVHARGHAVVAGGLALVELESAVEDPRRPGAHPRTGQLRRRRDPDQCVLGQPVLLALVPATESEAGVPVHVAGVRPVAEQDPPQPPAEQRSLVAWHVRS